MRATAAVTLGARLGITALLLGEWPAAPPSTSTPTATPDWSPARRPNRSRRACPCSSTDTAVADPAHPAGSPHRRATAHRRRRREPPRRPRSPPSSRPSRATHVSVAGVDKARLRVLGPPGIDDITGPGRPLRAKALELAVFLACHPDGMSTRDIGEYLEPDARVSQADQRVHTNASNLRHVFGRAAGPAQERLRDQDRGPLPPRPGHGRRRRLAAARPPRSAAHCQRTAPPRTARAGLRPLPGPLAEGHDYDWVQPHREAVRRWGIEAHLALADDLLDSDPQAASDLLDKAISLDRYNEAVYVKAMHARHALGDADGIRILRARPDQSARRPRRRTPPGHDGARRPPSIRPTNRPALNVASREVPGERPAGRLSQTRQRGSGLICPTPFAVREVLAALRLLARYFSTTSCGIRPRSLMSIPCALAQARIAAFSSRPAAELPRGDAGPRTSPPRPTLVPAVMYGSTALRNLSAFLPERSISYAAPSNENFTVSSAVPPSRSSIRVVIT